MVCVPIRVSVVTGTTRAGHYPGFQCTLHGRVGFALKSGATFAFVRFLTAPSVFLENNGSKQTTCSFYKAKMEPLSISEPSVGSRLINFRKRLRVLLKSEAAEFERLLRQLEGCEIVGLEQKKEVATIVQEICHHLGIRFTCPKHGCEMPSILRASATPRCVDGLFQFEHSIDRTRTRHAGSTKFPLLKVVLLNDDCDDISQRAA